MIYPSRRAIVLAAAGAPLALAVGLVSPGLWTAAAGWIAFALALVLADLMLAAPRRSLIAEVRSPRVFNLGRQGEAVIDLSFRGRAPRRVEAALSTNERIAAEPERGPVDLVKGAGAIKLVLQPSRRGEAVLERLWVRWTGPLGLTWTQFEQALDRTAPITPDVRGVKDEALRLFARDAAIGVKPENDTGQGSDFHALTDFQTGMDVRSIDWKQSARHHKLVAKEFRTERNHHVILALDSGRVMSEPLEGMPRIDRALNAALLLAFVSLKLGDKVGLYAFDAKPRLASGVVTGAAAFPLLQRLASSIDYSTEETNFTLGLTNLAGRLERRSLVVVFTDFSDSTSAELMIENLGRLLRRHLVVFVVFRDEELEAIARAEPLTADDVSRAVVAASLLRERAVVVQRLRRLGVEIVDVPAASIGPGLVNAYLDAKRRDIL